MKPSFILALLILTACSTSPDSRTPMALAETPTRAALAFATLTVPRDAVASLRGITIRILDVTAKPRPSDVSPDLAKPGDVLVVVNLVMTNQSDYSIYPGWLTLVDQGDQPYFVSSKVIILPAISSTISPYQSASGNVLFFVPASALNNNLILRFETTPVVAENSIRLRFDSIGTPDTIL